jgi:hypothetical protein
MNGEIDPLQFTWQSPIDARRAGPFDRAAAVETIGGHRSSLLLSASILKELL